MSYATHGILTSIATVTNYTAGVDTAGWPNKTGSSPAGQPPVIVPNVPCRIIINSSREGIEQQRILGRTQYIGRLSKLSASGADVAITTDSLVSVDLTTYEVKSPPRSVLVANSPVIEVDLELKT